MTNLLEQAISCDERRPRRTIKAPALIRRGSLRSHVMTNVRLEKLFGKVRDLAVYEIDRCFVERNAPAHAKLRTTTTML